MLVEGKHYRTIWPNKALRGVTIIDQTINKKSDGSITNRSKKKINRI